jgi:hypothetical protein
MSSSVTCFDFDDWVVLKDLETQEIVYSGHGGGELIRWLLDAMEIEKVSLTVGPYENVEAKIKAWEKKQRKNRESKKRHSG